MSNAHIRVAAGGLLRQPRSAPDGRRERNRSTDGEADLVSERDRVGHVDCFPNGLSRFEQFRGGALINVAVAALDLYDASQFVDEAIDLTLADADSLSKQRNRLGVFEDVDQAHRGRPNKSGFAEEFVDSTHPRAGRRGS